jgi:hypothetical protein
MASVIWRIFAISRPSEKLGTHSTTWWAMEQNLMQAEVTISASHMCRAGGPGNGEKREPAPPPGKDSHYRTTDTDYETR